jgi:aldose 1-epimerase
MLNQILFQKDIQGKRTDLFILKNKRKTEVAITNYGARLVGCSVVNRIGELVDVITGFGSLDEYLNTPDPYYGCIVGRFANRVAYGKFFLEGMEYSLPVNNGVNHLHGGPEGFHAQVWDVEKATTSELVLCYYSPHGEQGYPGNLKVKVIFKLSETDELSIEYQATTDHTTIVNLTSHPFFNLNGEGSGLITDHQVSIQADFFTPINEALIPTGELRKVDDSPFDFRKPKTIGAHIQNTDRQVEYGNGYDHNFVLKKSAPNAFELAASVYSQASGIHMDVYTTEPGIQLYTGNFMMGRNSFKNGAIDNFRTALCLETQHFPDSPNHPAFPSVVLTSDKAFYSKTVYAFSVRN